MSEKKKDIKEVEVAMDQPQSAEGTPQEQPNFFEFGDVYFECNRCGDKSLLDTGVKDGLQFVLPTSDQHQWRMVCGKCQNMMRIFFKESEG